MDAVLKKDEAQRRAGAALAAYAVQALQKRGVRKIRTNANVDEIIKDGDSVVGLTVIQDGKKQNLRAAKGVMAGNGAAGG